MPTYGAERKKFWCTFSWVVVQEVILLLLVCQAVDAESRVFVMFPLFAVHLRSIFPLLCVWPVCPAPPWLFLFHFLSMDRSSPPPHIFIFFAWHLILSCCLSFSLPQSSRLFFGSLLVCLWCPHGRLNDWSHKAVPPTHTYAELSCPKLRCWFSRSAHLKEKAECDSHEKVGGAGPGGWLNRLSVASQKCSLAHGRCNDK